MRLIHTCVSYILLLSFWVYIKSKNIHFYNINKILFHQKTMMTHSCNAPIRTIRHVKRMKTIKKQHSGKMKSNHHLPEFDSVFFSSEKKKSDSEFIFFFSEFISPSLRSIATKTPEVPVQLFRVFPF